MERESVQTRYRRQPHHEKAYDVQFAGGVEGAIKWTIGGAAACAVAHWYFPFFRRQTLALKAFLTSSCTVAGLVVGADTHLLRYEAQRRREENHIRRIGQIELGKLGIIASEPEYAKWRAMYDEQIELAKKARVEEEYPQPDKEALLERGDTPTSTVLQMVEEKRREGPQEVDRGGAGVGSVNEDEKGSEGLEIK